MFTLSVVEMRVRSKMYLFLIPITLYLFFGGCKKDFSPIRNGNQSIPIPDTTQNPYVLTTGGYPDWSPTGDKIAFIRDNDLWIYDLKNWQEEEIMENATEPYFSPDGKKITFEREKKIYTINLETNNETYIAEGITPSWSENGKWIAFGHKNAQKVLTDGTQVWGEPSPDSSLYYYDLEAKNINRVIIINYDSLWIGTSLSMSQPEWARKDSLIFFDTEFGIYKVSSVGGEAILFWKNPYALRKIQNMNFDELAYSGQLRWSRSKNLTIRFYTEDLRPYGGVIKNIKIESIPPDMPRGNGIFVNNDNSDPAWSPNGEKIVCVVEGKLWIKDIKYIYN